MDQIICTFVGLQFILRMVQYSHINDIHFFFIDNYKIYLKKDLQYSNYQQKKDKGNRRIITPKQ